MWQGGEGILSCYLRIVLVDELLDHRQGLLLLFEFSCLLWQDLSDFSEEIGAHVLVSVALENVTRQFNSFVAVRVDEMTEVAAGAPGWSVVVSARNSAIVTRFDQLVGVGRSSWSGIAHLRWQLLWVYGDLCLLPLLLLMLHI